MSIKPNSNIIFSNLNINTKSKKSRARNMKYFMNKRKLIPFLEDWWRINEENGGFVRENGGFGRGRGKQDNEKACDAWENWKVFENCLEYDPICAKHMFFETGMSREQIAKSSRQKPLTQILKNLSKCFSRLGSPLASKSRRKLQIILSKLVTGASTRKPIAKLGHGNVKNPEIFKFFYVFFVTRGLTCQKSTRNWGLATGVTCKNESPEQSCTVFEIFDFFQNKNTFQKQLKYLKIILCLINIWLSKCNTFN